ncbi:MAG TPA: carboxypeptidase-like regulatory domain-containing protein, partial [Blastocatellia bacterium]|nr:carboxypeptidase-like regulatory domain-containing protein [Blastocatellia bacterium]
MTKHRTLFFINAVALLLTILALSTQAQTNKATIVGTVTDSGGAVVAGANVTVVNIGTNAERKVTTNEDGTFVVALLDIGNYKVTASASGFKDVARENIVLQIGDRLPVDIQLSQASGTSETVEITAGAPIIERESSDRSGVITGREVTELPLSGRNFTLLATLMPGVARGSNVGFGGSGPDSRQFNNGDPRAGGGGPNSSNAQGDTPTARFARSGGGSLVV